MAGTIPTGKGRRCVHVWGSAGTVRLVRGQRVGLVGCVKQKRSTPAPARDLYTSTLFRGRRRRVEQTCASWFVLSARYGLVFPQAVLAPYDETLTGASRDVKRAWSSHVLAQLAHSLGHLGWYTFEIHAGAEYRDWGLTDGLRAAGAIVDVPAAGLRQGEQLALYRVGPASELARAVRSGR
jgi:hypothetical protein